MHTPSHPNDPTPTNTDAVYLLVAVLRLLMRGSDRSGWGTYLDTVGVATIKPLQNNYHGMHVSTSPLTWCVVLLEGEASMRTYWESTTVCTYSCSSNSPCSCDWDSVLEPSFPSPRVPVLSLSTCFMFTGFAGTYPRATGLRREDSRLASGRTNARTLLYEPLRLCP